MNEKEDRIMNEKNIELWRETKEGQFFERKSAWERKPPNPPRQRKAVDIAWDVVETLSAMANADGGDLVIGIEDDGELTGVPHPQDKIDLLLNAPREKNRVSPPLRLNSRVAKSVDGLIMLHFSVDWSPDVHRLSDGRYLLRVGHENSPFPAEQIFALKKVKSEGLFERSFPPSATIDSLDSALISKLFLEDKRSPEEILRGYGLIEGRNGHSVPTLAALLLFGKDPQRWHPRCGIDFVRWDGTERKHGERLNITKRLSIEGPLAMLIKQGFEAIKPFIRERHKLHDLFFSEKLEYPSFVWQEALINAVAHRNYSIQGTPIEIWMFDDRMEIRSPGLPPDPVTIEALTRREHTHLSRNPLIVRVLTDLGYMRELGEGIPRMFDEMERAGYYPPQLSVIGGMTFQVLLKNEPVYDDSTLEWLQKFRSVELSGDQKRVLAFAHAHGGQFTNRDYQKVISTDIYSASNSIKDMVRKGVVRSTGKGSRVYETSEPLQKTQQMPAELVTLLPHFRSKSKLANIDIRTILNVSRPTATRIAEALRGTGWLVSSGTKRWTRYQLSQRAINQPGYESKP